MNKKDHNRYRNHTVSFRLSPIERKTLEERMKASGLKKNDYFLQSCLYGRIVVVGSRVHIDHLIDALHDMELMLMVLSDELKQENNNNLSEETERVKNDYYAMINAFLEIAIEGNKSILKQEKCPCNLQGHN